MDLTVEIHGDAASLEECLDQFTVTEWLHGENMYKCDGYGCFCFCHTSKIGNLFFFWIPKERKKEKKKIFSLFTVALLAYLVLLRTWIYSLILIVSEERIFVLY